MAQAIINDYSAKMFTLNGIQYVRNFVATRRGNRVTIMNAYDTRFGLISGDYSEFIINGNTFGSAITVVSILSPILFVKDEVSMIGGESDNSIADAVFHNSFGSWVKSPSSPASGNINIDMTGAVNGGICAIYYSGAVLTKSSFIGGTITILSGSNTLNELCIVWIVYDQGNNAFQVNIQNGATGDIPDPSDETSPVITVTDPAAATETSPIITVTDPIIETSPVITVT